MKNVLRVWIVGLIVALLPGVIAAQNPPEDPPSPPAFGVCQELRGGTPGLYGLCVAVCSAHGCEPDFAQVDPFSECKPADAGLIELYNGLKEPEDPGLPCVPPGPCPCFTQEQVDAFPTPYSQCLIDGNIGGDIVTNIIVEQFVTGAQASLGTATPPSCAFGLDGDFVFLTTSLEQALACRQIIVNTINANPGACP